MMSFENPTFISMISVGYSENLIVSTNWERKTVSFQVAGSKKTGARFVMCLRAPSGTIFDEKTVSWESTNQHTVKAIRFIFCVNDQSLHFHQSFPSFLTERDQGFQTKGGISTQSFLAFNNTAETSHLYFFIEQQRLVIFSMYRVVKTSHFQPF